MMFPGVFLIKYLLTFHFDFCAGDDFFNNAGVEQGGGVTEISGVTFADLAEDPSHDLS